MIFSLRNLIKRFTIILASQLVLAAMLIAVLAADALAGDAVRSFRATIVESTNLFDEPHTYNTAVTWKFSGDHAIVVDDTFQGTRSYWFMSGGDQLIASDYGNGIDSYFIYKKKYPVLPESDEPLEVTGFNTALNAFALAKTRYSTVTNEELNGVLTSKVFWKVTESCSGEGKGTDAVWIDQSTNLPVRVLRTRGTNTNQRDFSYSSLNEDIEDAAFAFPGPEGHPVDTIDDSRFRRRRLLRPNSVVRFTPRYPTWLPHGYELSIAGYARKSGYVGASEAEIPRMKGFVAARWNRGIERIDLTMRKSPSQAVTVQWLQRSPFSMPCSNVVKVRKIGFSGEGRGKLAISDNWMPVMWWHQNGVLYTLTGSVSPGELVKVAKSLKAGA